MDRLFCLSVDTRPSPTIEERIRLILTCLRSNLRLEARLHTITGLLEQLEEDLLGALTVLALQLHLVLHLLAHVLQHLDQRVLAVLTGLLLNVQTILNLHNLLVHALHDGVLLRLARSALGVDPLTKP